MNGFFDPPSSLFSHCAPQASAVQALGRVWVSGRRQAAGRKERASRGHVPTSIAATDALDSLLHIRPERER